MEHGITNARAERNRRSPALLKTSTFPTKDRENTIANMSADSSALQRYYFFLLLQFFRVTSWRGHYDALPDDTFKFQNVSL